MNKNVLKIVAIAVTIVGLMAFDQATKRWAEQELAGKGVVSIVSDIVVLNFAQNRGAFLSMGNQLPDELWWVMMILVPILFLIALTVYVFLRKSKDWFFLFFFALVFAGGAGNLVDRIFVGKVTDFMNMGLGGLGSWFRTGIFNVADLYIVIAVALMVFQGSFTKKKKTVAKPEK